ncbi:hypothetical protein [Novosphingobium sp.]|nr:hypothetical protein [Novosphingobium sp.]
MRYNNSHSHGAGQGTRSGGAQVEEAVGEEVDGHKRAVAEPS